MISKVLSATALALAASQLASAQTFTACNPLEKKCPDDPALGGTVVVDFTQGANDFFEVLAGTTISNYDKTLGAEFTINKETDAPTIQSKKYIFFGTVSVVTRACYGTGVVSSIVLQSDDLDEIDWEWLGGDKAQVQTNYFGKGDTTTYDRGAYHPVADPQDNFYNYTIDWTPDFVRWYIDGSMVRELKYADAKGGSTFPQTPAQLKLGNWVAGRKDAPEGTVKWAGGYTDFSQAPFHAYYKSITVTDYHKGATSYVWPDVPAGGKGDGSWKGIKVVTDGSSSGSSTTSSASASSTGGSQTNSTTASTTRGLTQATDGADTNSTASFSSTIRPTGTTTSSAAASSTSAPGRNAGVKEGLNTVLLGAALFLGYVAL